MHTVILTVFSLCVPYFTLALPQPYPIADIKPRFELYWFDGTIAINYNDVKSRSFGSIVDELHGKGILCSKIIFIVHGFRSNIKTKWMHRMKDELLKFEQNNALVVIVGWGGGADLWLFDYPEAAANTEITSQYLDKFADAFDQATANCPNVAQHVGSAVDAIKQRKDDTYIHCVGHSLGAHICGMMGKYDPGRIDRITGLDPAGPLFENDPHMRLNTNDAAFVDVIHTDGYFSPWHWRYWFEPVKHYGSMIPMGHVDFFPNKGYEQPGCTSAPWHIACSHERAYEYFVHTINHQGNCQAWLVCQQASAIPEECYKNSNEPVEMGYHVNNNSRGLHYLETNGKAPYCPKESFTPGATEL